MAHGREGLLAQIEAGVLDDTVPLASLLQMCIVLGGQAGSEEMRAWARRELNGYGAEKAPDYRHIPTVLIAMITNEAGYNPITQRVNPSVFPRQIRDFLRDEGVDLEVAVLSSGIGELEALAKQGKDEYQLVPSWGSIIVDTLNRYNVTRNSRVAEVYWSVSGASLRGLLVRVRTALAELAAELIALTPPTQEVPDKSAADHAVHFVVTGDRPTIHYTSQHATDGGTNVAVGTPGLGPVTVASARGSAISSQTASGPNSSGVGHQTAHGDHNPLAGRDAGAVEPVGKQGWWTRLRKRGAVVAFTTIVGGIAGVVATVIAILTWVGWMPWS